MIFQFRHFAFSHCLFPSRTSLSTRGIHHSYPFSFVSNPPDAIFFSLSFLHISSSLFPFELVFVLLSRYTAQRTVTTEQDGCIDLGLLLGVKVSTRPLNLREERTILCFLEKALSEKGLFPDNVLRLAGYLALSCS
jgi:hypothetical protein